MSIAPLQARRVPLAGRSVVPTRPPKLNAREARGRGLGRQLYEALEAQLKAMGILNLYACIAVPDEEDEYLTHASERFHAHLGYRLAGSFRQCACKFGRWYSMVWMEKHLGERRNDPPTVRWRCPDR